MFTCYNFESIPSFFRSGLDPRTRGEKLINGIKLITELVIVSISEKKVKYRHISIENIERIAEDRISKKILHYQRKGKLSKAEKGKPLPVVLYGLKRDLLH